MGLKWKPSIPFTLIVIVLGYIAGVSYFSEKEHEKTHARIKYKTHCLRLESDGTILLKEGLETLSEEQQRNASFTIENGILLVESKLYDSVRLKIDAHNISYEQDGNWVVRVKDYAAKGRTILWDSEQTSLGTE